MAITDTQINNAIPLTGGSTPHPTQANQVLTNELLKAIRDEVATAITAANLEQSTGTQTDKAMSQDAITTAVGSSVSKSGLLAGTGSATDNAMSQKAVTDQLIGVGQTWTNVTASRFFVTNYTNDTGRTIVVNCSPNITASSVDTSILGFVDGVIVQALGVPETSAVLGYSIGYISLIVPPGATYRIEAANLSNVRWLELR